MTTVVLAVGVVVVLVFGLHTAGRGLEELTETEQLRDLADEVTHHRGGR
jgi:putative MFS transporter